MEIASLFVDHHEKDRTIARIIAAIFALLLLLFILYPFWSYPFPPPGQSGILVVFGNEEGGGDNEVYDSQSEAEVQNPSNDQAEEQSSEVFQRNVPTNQPSQPDAAAIKTKSATQAESEIAIKDRANNKPSEEVKKLTEKEIADQRAAEEAKKKAEYEQAKKQFGDLIGKGPGENNTNTKAGDPAGDPNTDVLTGISAGKGNIGGGLADRGVLFEPEIDEHSQKAGKVVVRVCVNERGEVVEARYTQSGSTTTDTDLVNVAIAGAKRYKFSRSPIERQCGTITIEFKLK